jgi:hypothetical protein
VQRSASQSTPEPTRLDLTQVARSNAALLRRITKTDPKPPTTEPEEDPK